MPSVPPLWEGYDDNSEQDLLGLLDAKVGAALDPADEYVDERVTRDFAPAIASHEWLKRRADEAGKYVDPERCAISPQCGFASTIGGNPVTEVDERAKLRLCVEAARSIWGD